MPYLDPTQISEGPVFVLLGKSALDVTPDVLPADTVPIISAGGSWGGTWRSLGFTPDDGVTAGGMAPDTTPVMVAQQRGPATVLKGSSAQTIGFTLLEMTAENLRDALGQGTITSITTSDELALTDDPTRYYALGIEGYGPKGKPLRIIYPIVTISVTGDINLRWGSPQSVPVQATRSGAASGVPKWRFLK